ncbi:hypothetical protein ACIF80_15920 [Streptomyces sp. NPDC085927]|uniref:hypothetical protein n=1 Tax=Streptomyces sp. NPDC085927 TaxID=3365738 RepID=UPI0037D0E933
MQDHAFSPAGSGTALPRARGALGDPTRPGTVRVFSGARFPGLRSAPLPAVVAGHVGGHVTEARDED